MIAYKRLWPGKIVQFPCRDSFAGETAVMAMRIGLTQPDSYIYLPLHNLNTDYLDALFGQLLHPFLLLGDLNGRHHLWGNTSCNPRGRILDSSFSRDVVFFLNSDTLTHFQIQTGTFSVRFTWCTVGVHLAGHGRLTWKWPLPNAFGVSEWYSSSWGEEMAATVVMQGSVKDFNCIQDIDDHFTSLIHFVAESSIPISSRQYHRPSVTSNCQRKKSCSKIAETMTQQCALIQYKWTQAKARRVLKEARLLERANPFHPCSEDRWHNAHRPKRCCKWASKFYGRDLWSFLTWRIKVKLEKVKRLCKYTCRLQ